jgi:hypothetical protein
MKTTENSLKKVTKVSQGNNNEDPKDYDFLKATRQIKADNCVSNLTHRFMCKHEFLKFIGDDPISNKKLVNSCCEKELRERYNFAINNHDFSQSFEIFEDIHIDRWVLEIGRFLNVCKCGNTTSEEDKRIEQIHADLKTSFREKIHIPELKTATQSYEYLTKQHCEIEESDEAIIVKFPQDRDFPIKDEMKAINIMNEFHGELSFNFKDHCVIIVKEAEI